jgi:hypothetical protein
MRAKKDGTISIGFGVDLADKVPGPAILLTCTRNVASIALTPGPLKGDTPSVGLSCTLKDASVSVTDGAGKTTGIPK